MASVRKAQTRAPKPMWSWRYWRDRVMTIAYYTTPDAALEQSYAAYVRGEAYTDYVQLPDETRLHHVDRDGNRAEDQRDTLSAAWDEWLLRHPEQRAAWDSEPQGARLQALETQHVLHPRPFTSESIIANPAWYRRLYGILGMTDEQFDTLLHVHRFAVAEQEAQRLAKDQEKGTQGTPDHKRRLAAIYLEGYSSVAEHPLVSLQTQERACRAYCKRQGYTVHRVYRAVTPPPRDVPLHQEIGMGAGHAFVYFRYESDHPYHVVHNLAEARTIDVRVQFVEFGPSRSLYGDSLADASSRLCPVEMASLWEIEPPTEDERRLHELLTRLGDTETEEERSALLGELDTLSQKMKKMDRRSTSRTRTPVRAVVKMEAIRPKLCFACRTRPARDGSAFCSDACAQAAAERHVQTTTRGWCGTCGAWIGQEGCPHSR